MRLLLLSLVALASAYTFPDGFDLNQVKPSDKGAWCVAERNSCPKICGGVASANTCDSSTLQFTCKCSNGTDADVSPYTETIPFFVCQANYGQCIERASSLDDDEKCKEGLGQCGKLNASEATSSSTTSSSVSLPTETSSSSSEDESSSSSTTTTGSSAAATTSSAAMRLAQEHATGLLAGVLMMGMRLVL
ncbi:hypothetical protein BDV59DRAFT_205392 [Aspergillus ambiguus]|uniref:uncharacterized protein n=1 Tax=Aspergillus ambiguus TaxID=176160 RepID=UPI003CCCF568